MELDNLTNPELDRLCAEKMEWKLNEKVIQQYCSGLYAGAGLSESNRFSPTTNEKQAMELLIELTDKHDVLLEHYNDTHYVECTHKAFETMFEGKDADLLVAIVKAYIMSKGE